MSRGVLTALLLILAAAPAAGDGPPPAALTLLTGRLEVPPNTDDVFTLHVFTGWGYGIAEVLAERRLDRGSFEVKIPVPDRPYFAVVTSPRHQPVVRSFRGGQRQPRFKKPIRPQPWNKVAVTTTESDGRAAKDVVITSRFRPGALALLHWLPWFETETASGADGVALVPWGEKGRLSLTTERAPPQDREIRRTLGPVHFVRRSATMPIFFRVRLWSEEEGGDRFVDRTHLRVEFRVDGEWRPAAPPVAEAGGFARIDGWDAVRVTCPRHRPFVLLRGDRPDVTHVECVLEAEESLHREGSSLHVVPFGLGPPDPSFAPPCGMSVRWCRVPPFRMELLDATGRRCDPGFLDGAAGPGLPAGAYTLKVRGRLGRPVVRRIQVPAKSAVRVPVDVTGGSGILLLVRRADGRLEKTVSFRVTDASGTVVPVEYTGASRRGVPAFAIEDRRFVDAPNAGLIRLDPGEWRVELLDGESVSRTFTVRAWPNTVTRLDTRAGAGKPGSEPKKTVRLR